MQDNYIAAKAAYFGIVASATIFLGIGALLGGDLTDLLQKVAYGIGMGVTARWCSGLLYPVLVRRAAKCATDETSA